LRLRVDIALASVVIAIFGVFCVGLPVLIWRHGPSAGLFLGVGDAVLSWPVAVVVVALVFFKRFGAGLDFFLRNIGSMKLPGGVEIQSQAATPKESTSAGDDGSITLTSDQQAALQGFVTELEQRQKLTEIDKSRLEEQFQEALRASVSWKFRYLTFYLVPNSKQVLYWFSQRSPQSRSDFHTLWGLVIPHAHERDTILRVLLEHGLLHETDESLQITQEGYSFLQYIGLLPYPPVGS